MKKANAELADAKAALNKAKSDLAASNKATADELAGLQSKNKALAADLDAAKKQANKDAEVVKLRKEVDTAWAEVEKLRLAAAHKTPAPAEKVAAPTAQNFKPATGDDAVKQVLEKQLAELQKQNADLKARLEKLQPKM